MPSSAKQCQASTNMNMISAGHLSHRKAGKQRQREADDDGLDGKEKGRGIADFLASQDGELPALPTITTTNSSPLTTFQIIIIFCYPSAWSYPNHHPYFNSKS
jgi:hypothetical protein